ncbi:MAG: hypothetical protein AAF726_12715 [Planctomycetota bacterium]
MLRHASLFAPAAALLSLASADVLVVGESGTYPSIQAAIDAAAPGDTVLVRALADIEGRYDGFVIDGKPITIRGQGRPFVLTGAATVRNIGPGEVVILDGLDLNRKTFPRTQIPSSDTSGPGLAVESSQGTVRVVRSSMEGSFADRMWAGLQLTAALDVTLDECEVIGALAPTLEEQGGAALQSVSSRVSVYRSTIVGGKGDSGTGSFEAEGSDGGTGLVLLSRSVAWLADSTVRGGEGGDADCDIYVCDDYPGDGGTGMIVQPGSIAFESRSTFEGGAGGTTGFNSFTADGVEGAATVGSYASDPNTHVEVDVDVGHVRDDGVNAPSVRVTAYGTPGESARVAIARGGGFRFFGASRGVLQVSDYASTPAFVPLGTIPPSGFVTQDVVLPSVAADASSPLFLQVAVDGSAGPSDFRLSSPITVAVDGADVPSNFDRTRVFVDADATPGGDASSWSEASPSIEAALAELPWGRSTEVWLRQGTYVMASQVGPLLPSGTRLIGGFGGGESSADQADPRSHPTTIDGDRLGNGSATTGDSWTFFRVGDRGLEIQAEDVEIRGLRFTGAHDPFSPIKGAAIVVYGDALVEECAFEDNAATPLRLERGDLSVRRTEFIGNWGRDGGAVSAWTLPELEGQATLDIESCVFNGNGSLVNRGGALFANRIASIRVDGSTFHANDANNSAGALFTLNVESVWFTNNVVFANSAVPNFAQEITNQLRLQNAQSIVFQYNSVEELRFLWNVNGNVIGDPQFVDRLGANGVAGDADDDLRLGPGSHAIDAGNSLYLRPWALLDVAGEPRRRDDPSVADTGVGAAPVVDMGAYER